MLEQRDRLLVGGAVQRDAVHRQHLVAAPQPAVARRRAARKHALDDDRKVPALAAVPAHDSETETVRAATQRHLPHRLAEHSATAYAPNNRYFQQTHLLTYQWRN